MTLNVAIGQAQALDGREAAAQATHRALEQAGRDPIALGLVIASHHFPFQQVLNGVSTLVGDTPLFGFSTSGEITRDGLSQRSVVVALLSGSSLQARADWWPGFTDDSRAASQKMAQGLGLYQSSGTLLIATDGLNGDAKQLCASLPHGDYRLAGCLAGGDLHRRKTYQIGGRQAGNGGLAAALLTGNVGVGIGLSHGWRAIGPYFRVTKSRGPWLRSLDDQPTAETYARLLGYTAREWAFPPLNELVRLYPLGLEEEGKPGLLVRAAMRMETDGSLRMHTAIPEGSTAHLMVGSSETCRQAAEQAARQALADLKGARPMFALTLVDVAWQMLMESQPGSEIAAVRGVLGESMPLIGGYSFGQLARPPSSDLAELYNQHIQVIVFGENE